MWSLSLVRPVALFMAVLLACAAPLSALDGTPEGEVPVPTGTAFDLRALADAEGPPQDMPLVTGTMNERTVVTDPEEDVDLQYVGTNPLPPQDADAPIDIVSVSVAETDQEVVFKLKHRAYPEAEATLSDVAFMDAYCDIRFSVNGDKTRGFAINLGYLYQFEPGYTAYASLFATETEDDDGRTFVDYDHISSIPISLVSGEHFEMAALKQMLRPGKDAQSLKIGDQLTDFTSSCYRNSGTFFLRYLDTAAGDPKDDVFPITMATSTKEIALSLPEESAQNIAVATSQTSKVTVQIKNLVGRKLLVNLTAQVVDQNGAPLEGWSVNAAPTLELKSEGDVAASIIVSVDPSVPHRQNGILKVVAFPLGFEDKATFTVRTFAVQPLGPDDNVLRFHRAPQQGYYCMIFCLGGAEPEGAMDPYPDVFVLNLLENDPVYTTEEGTDDGLALFSADYTYAYLDAPLGAPLRFDPEGFIELKVALKTEVAREVSFSANIWTSAEESLGSLRADIELGPNVEEHTFNIPVNENLLDLPQGTMLGLSMDFRDRMISFGGGTWISSIEWAPAQSSLTLPLVGLPRAQVNITDGSALPSVSLGNQTDKEEYVNPGEAQAFDLVLLNEGTKDDVLRVTTTASAPGWTVSFDPGNRFSLAPGASAPLCMTVTAPEDAVEGDVVNITLSATSKIDPDVKTDIDLTLLVTTGVDVEPSTCREISEEDYVSPLPDTTEESPAPGLLVGIVLLGLVGAASRRRD